MVMTLQTPLDSVMLWIETNTGSPTKPEFMLTMCPDKLPRGLRTPADLFQNARKAAREGKNQDALDWLLVAVSHDEGAQNVLRENSGEVLRRLVG